MRVALLVLAELGQRMVDFFGFKDAGRGLVALRAALFNDGFFLGGGGEKDVVRLSVLIGQAQVVGPRKPKPFQNRVEQLLPGKGFIILSARNVAQIETLLAELPEWADLLVSRPPVVFLDSGLQVVVGEKPFRLPELADFRQTQFRMLCELLPPCHVAQCSQSTLLGQACRDGQAPSVSSSLMINLHAVQLGRTGPVDFELRVAGQDGTVVFDQRPALATGNTAGWAVEQAFGAFRLERHVTGLELEVGDFAGDAERDDFDGLDCAGDFVRDPVVGAALGAEQKFGVQRVVGIVQCEAVGLRRDT